MWFTREPALLGHFMFRDLCTIVRVVNDVEVLPIISKHTTDFAIYRRFVSVLPTNHG